MQVDSKTTFSPASLVKFFAEQHKTVQPSVLKNVVDELTRYTVSALVPFSALEDPHLKAAFNTINPMLKGVLGSLQYACAMVYLDDIIAHRL